MPENPTLNSARMQRAQRINNIEEARLSTRIYLLGKERRHHIRIANQDMRMVNLTLEYINASSGYSPEAIPPRYVEPQVEKTPEQCFMYGERLRRWKTSRRVQSAPSISISRRVPAAEKEEAAPDATFTADSIADNKKKCWGSAYFPMERIREHNNSDLGRSSVLTVQARVRPLTAVAPRDPFARGANLSRADSVKDLSEKDIGLLPEGREQTLEASKQQLEAAKQDRNKLMAHGRQAAITQTVNRVRVIATSAKQMRNVTPMQALVKPPAKTIRQNTAWNEKVSLNVDRNQKIYAKLKLFVTSYPIVRTHGVEV